MAYKLDESVNETITKKLSVKDFYTLFGYLEEAVPVINLIHQKQQRQLNQSILQSQEIQSPRKDMASCDEFDQIDSGDKKEDNNNDNSR